MMGLGMLMGGGHMNGSARDNAPRMVGKGPQMPMGLGGMMGGQKAPMGGMPNQPQIGIPPMPQQGPPQGMPPQMPQLPPQGMGQMLNNPQFMQMLQQHMGQYGGRGGYLGAIR